jgi:1-acyl-sn-glycerol-3-phosphate acyltransferase
MKTLIARLFLRLLGWEIEGVRPSSPRVVLIAAPHTTNWDFPITLAVAKVFGVKIRWMGKDSLFRFPFGGIMRSLGGIPVRRSQRNNIVQQMAEDLMKYDELALTVPAEGTRGRVEYWKSGFYHIAKTANVPIVLAYLDYTRKRGGFGPEILPTSDIRADMDRIRAFYADKQGKYPENFGPVRLREEEASSEPTAEKAETTVIRA